VCVWGSGGGRDKREKRASSVRGRVKENPRTSGAEWSGERTGEEERTPSGRANMRASKLTGTRKEGGRRGRDPYSRARETERENPVAWRRAI